MRASPTNQTNPPARRSSARRRRPPWRAAALAIALACVAVEARAEPTAADKAAAEALFDEGRKLVLAGDYLKAAEKFEASQRLDAGVGTLLYLADAYEKAGRTASAWATFREAASSARATGQTERENIARERASALEAKLSYLTLSLGPGADVPGLRVTRNKDEVKAEVLGSPVPTDPGSYTVEATAPGKKPWTGHVAVPSTPGTIALTVPELDNDPERAEPPAAPSSRPPSSRPPPAEPSPPAASRSKPQLVLGLITGGAGIVGLGVGGGFLGRALSKNQEADAHCTGTHCRDLTGVSLSKDAKSAADIATIAFGVGGTLLLGGVLLVLTTPSQPAAPAESARQIQVTPLVGASAGGLVLGGRF